MRAWYRSGGLGVHAPLPGRNNGLDALLLPLGAEGVAVIGPVGDQAGQRRVRLGFHQGPGLGAVVALAPPPRHAQAQGTAASIRKDVDLGAEAAPAAARAGSVPSRSRARARPCCRVQFLEAYAGVGGAERPMDALLGRVAVFRPGGALRGAKACRVRTLSSGSALWSQRPCRGVNTRCTCGARRCASAGGNARKNEA